LPTQFCTTARRSLIPAACRDLVEGSDARVHFHRRVEAVGVSGGVAAPAAFAHHDRCEVEVEGLADARLDAAIGAAAADEDGVAPQHVRSSATPVPQNALGRRLRKA
jgi:hypothetical protein